MQITINGQQQFQVLTSSFTIGPADAYTLQVSADGTNFSSLFAVAADTTRMVTGVASGSYYRLFGNARNNVTVNWVRSCNDGQGGGGGEYILPIASTEILGGIKVGENLSIDENGVLSAQGGEGGDSTTLIAVEELPTSGVNDGDVKAIGDGVYQVQGWNTVEGEGAYYYVQFKANGWVPDSDVMIVRIMIGADRKYIYYKSDGIFAYNDGQSYSSLEPSDEWAPMESELGIKYKGSFGEGVAKKKLYIAIPSTYQFVLSYLGDYSDLPTIEQYTPGDPIPAEVQTPNWVKIGPSDVGATTLLQKTEDMPESEVGDMILYDNGNSAELYQNTLKYTFDWVEYNGQTDMKQIKAPTTGPISIGDSYGYTTTITPNAVSTTATMDYYCEDVKDSGDGTFGTRCFDNNRSTKVCIDAWYSTEIAGWIMFTADSNYVEAPNYYGFMVSDDSGRITNRQPKSWRLYGFDTLYDTIEEVIENGTLLDQRVDEDVTTVAYTKVTWSCESERKYPYYAFVLDDTVGGYNFGYWQFSELYLGHSGNATRVTLTVDSNNWSYSNYVWRNTTEDGIIRITDGVNIEMSGNASIAYITDCQEGTQVYAEVEYTAYENYLDKRLKGLSFWKGTQDEYDAMVEAYEIDDNILYIITE